MIGNEGATVDKLIAVVDLTSGRLFDREKGTLTLDIPPDFDCATAEVLVSADRLGRYRTVAGESRVYMTLPRRLSQRDPGEECMVAAHEVDRSGAACVRHYRRSMVETVTTR